MGVVGDFPLKTESLRIMDVAVEDAFAVSVLIGVSLILGLVTVKDVKGAFLGRASFLKTCATNVARRCPVTPICPPPLQILVRIVCLALALRHFRLWFNRF